MTFMMAVILQAAALLGVGQQAQPSLQETLERETVLRGKFNQNTVVGELTRPLSQSGVNTWELRVIAPDGGPSPATLEIFRSDPAKSEPRSLCPPAVTRIPSQCRLEKRMAEGLKLWVRLSVTSDDADTEYVVIARGLTGVPLAGSTSYSDDALGAITLQSGQVDGVIEFAGVPTASERVYRYRGDGSGLLALTAVADSGLATLTLYDESGSVKSTSYSPAPQQMLVVPPDFSTGYVLVRADVTRPGQSLQYSIRTALATDKPSDAVADRLSRGHAFRTTIPGKNYKALLELANDEPGLATESGIKAAHEVHDYLTRALGLGYLNPSAQAGVDTPTPIVLFVGVGGNSRIVQLRTKKGGRETAVSVDPSYVSLGNAREFWAIYVEDDTSPFDTSIDVQFQSAAFEVDFETFNSLSTPRVVLDDADSARVTRLVKVGLRRFRIRQPPVSVRVAFTRQGATFGVRQWQRLYRVFGWQKVAFAINAFVPASEVSIAGHDVVQRDCGAPPCPVGQDGIVTDVILHRQLFVGASLQWPQVRARFNDVRMSNGVLAASRWLLLPDVMFAIGLPLSGPKVYYAGAAWPIGWRLHGTVGMIFSNQERLANGFQLGDKVPLNTPFNTLTTLHWIQQFTAGITIDLIRFP